MSPGTSLPTDSRQVGPLSFLLLTHTSFQNFPPPLPQRAPARASARLSGGRPDPRPPSREEREWTRVRLPGGKADRGVDERAPKGSFVCCAHGLCGALTARGRPCKDGLRQSAALRLGKSCFSLTPYLTRDLDLLPSCAGGFVQRHFCRESSGSQKKPN